MARLRPYVEPPSDLSVRSSLGGLYTGILLVERNKILTGIVIRSGHEPHDPPASPPFGRRITGSPTSPWASRSLADVLDDDDDDDGRLPGWGEDPRDVRDRWRR